MMQRTVSSTRAVAVASALNNSFAGLKVELRSVFAESAFQLKFGKIKKQTLKKKKKSAFEHK